MWISIGRASNSESGCEIAKDDIMAGKICPVDAGPDGFAIRGCESATGGGREGRAVGEDGRRKRALTRGRERF